jgi:hypothetical protein
MPARREFSILRKQVHHGHSSIGAVTFLSVAALIGLGAGVFFMLPDLSSNESPVAAATANAPQTTAAPDESFCDKQAWPYVDQRCAKRVEAARGTRQVRIVTDKGHSVTAVTPLPIVVPKTAPPAPTVAQAERPIGPAAAPVAAEPSPQAQTVAAALQAASAPAPQNPSPKTAAAPAPAVQVTVAPANRPAATNAMGQENPNPPADARNAAIPPKAASTEPMAPGMDAFADAPSKKSKSARAAKKAEKRDAKRRKTIEDGAVPDDVVAAVEEAAADVRVHRGRGVVTLGSPNGGQRIYLVPREQASGW